MYNLNQLNQITELKDYYIPAFHEVIKSSAKKKSYRLSIPLDGQVFKVKSSAKKIKHTSFAKVITGSVLRMKKLFEPDQLKLGVIINKNPDAINSYTLEFELVNKTVFQVEKDEHFLSILVSYSYSKPDTVTFMPIIYRKSCSNGAVAILSEKFKETISAENVLEIGCEWTRCNFSSYVQITSAYLEKLRNSSDDKEILMKEARELFRSLNKSKNQYRIRDGVRISRHRENDGYLEEILLGYMRRENIGSNRLAVFNAITEIASREEMTEARYQNFITIGKYLFRESNKLSKLNKDVWAGGIGWDQLYLMTK